MIYINALDYKKCCIEYLSRNGFFNIETIRENDIYGIDVLAQKGVKKYAIECKLSYAPITVHDVEQVCLGGKKYGCDISMIISNAPLSRKAQIETIGNNIFLLKLLDCYNYDAKNKKYPHPVQDQGYLYCLKPLFRALLLVCIFLYLSVKISGIFWKILLICASLCMLTKSVKYILRIRNIYAEKELRNIGKAIRIYVRRKFHLYCDLNNVIVLNNGNIILYYIMHSEEQALLLLDAKNDLSDFIKHNVRIRQTNLNGIEIYLNIMDTVDDESEEDLLYSISRESHDLYDAMDGHEFEYFCADLLRQNGFRDVNVTKASGDQGIDIIAYKDGIKYGIQCKCYSSDIGNAAVQQAYSGKTFYNCHVATVLTNRYFTSSAKELAQSNGVLLWDRNKLEELKNSTEKE